jgi:hypothetical protein
MLVYMTALSVMFCCTPELNVMLGRLKEKVAAAHRAEWRRRIDTGGT